ncbi:DUF2947 domain-containing protein [Shewanella litorisediminis]|uniref:DUF2947 domain-containing protein n=1 Tax=Shewanella litorisediminis TaxID=1173586 RepID=A0ABX7FZU5_9GAMM|nr:DUF2947 domain-containing protein [Shewanella litorisediminis]MCL2918338.1 DUF2947 domain-containing protein [Shewanella litorisediminis]QRH00615.1 DUF2947 domain-containing protein [Shewanella litorisediminis]
MQTSHIPLEQYRRKWIFNNKDLPVSDDDKACIYPLDEKSAMAVWKQLVSDKASASEHFSKADWGGRPKSWVKSDIWQDAWDCDEAALPPVVAAHFEWPDETRVFFCYDKYQAIETRWDVFVRNWKCFLFFDDGPLLISDSQPQVALFTQDGNVQLGVRS